MTKMRTFQFIKKVQDCNGNVLVLNTIMLICVQHSMCAYFLYIMCIFVHIITPPVHYLYRHCKFNTFVDIMYISIFISDNKQLDQHVYV